MANIIPLKDSAGAQFYPQTHEKAVVDSNGVTLASKLANISAPSYVVAWDGNSTPVVANIPAGVTFTYGGQTYTGTLAASSSTVNKTYLVYDNNGNFDEYITQVSGSTYSWVHLGNTSIDLSDYATKDELNQLDQEITVSGMSPATYTIDRNLRPASSSGKVITGNNDYDRVIPVTKGEYLELSFSFPSGYIRYGFTEIYPANDVPCTNAGSGGTSLTSLKLFAPADGFLLVAADQDFTSFTALTDATNGTIGNEVYNLKEQVKVETIIELPKTEVRNLRPTSNGVSSGNNGYGYLFLVREGEVLTIRQSVQNTTYFYRGFTRVYPVNGTPVTDFANGSVVNFPVVTVVAPYNGFLLIDYTAAPANVSVEKSTDKESIGYRVAILEQKAEEKIGADGFLGTPAPLNLFYPSICDAGYLGSDGKIIESESYLTTPHISATPGETIGIQFGRIVAQYDASGILVPNTWISIESESHYMTIASTAVSFRVSISSTNAYRAMITRGTLPTKYAPYRANVPFLTPLSKFAGKKMVIFGDSTSACIAERDTANWGMFVTDATGINVENVGVWSSRAALANSVSEVVNAFALCSLIDGIVTGDWDAQNIIYETSGYEQHAAQITKLKAIDFSAVDFVVVMIGTNDLGSDTPFETQGQPINKYSVNGALRYFVSQLLGAYPQIKILLMSPIFRFNPSTGNDYTVNGRGIQDFVDDYKGLGEELHLPVLDMLNIGVNKYNCDRYYGEDGGDGTHETSAMREVIGNRVAGALTSIY